MPNLLYRQNIISISDLSTPQLELLLHTALKLKTEPHKKLLEGKVIGSCFFEPSTRTRLSFETAVQRLGGTVIGFADGANTSAKKGETLVVTGAAGSVAVCAAVPGGCAFRAGAGAGAAG